MEQYYSNDSFTAFKTDDGILIEEKRKGSQKMLLFFLGLGIMLVSGSIIIGMFGGTIGRGIVSGFFWGGIIVAVVSLIAFLLNLLAKSERKITFHAHQNELIVRGKVFLFDDINEIISQRQQMMGKTMTMAFIKTKTGGKKKTLFSTAIVVPNPKELEDFINDLNKFVQNGKSST